VIDMGDIICRKCGALNPPVKGRNTNKMREGSKVEKGIRKTIRIIDKDIICALCGGEIDWIMS